MDYNILRENDIRGNYPKQINKEVAKRLGESWSYYLKENNISKCIIGHDNRLSSEELSETLINTILSSGIDVYDVGLVTTPMFNYASIQNDIPYGIMITASHNRASDNGFKIFGENFLHLAQDELKKLYKIFKSDKKIDGEGKLTEITIKKDYINMMLSKFPQMNDVSVVVDCGNGTASIVIKEILSKLFLNVTYLNCESDGSFPVHNPDPNVEENLKWLKDLVKLKKADLGIAVDGDCDRVGIVDEKGNTIFTDYLIAIYANEVIPYVENKNVIVDVKCSVAIPHEIDKIGGNPIMVKNGSAYIEGRMHDIPALIGGEYSGHVFFKDEYFGYDDGIYAGLRLARILHKTKIPASTLTEGMEKYESTTEIRLEVDDDIKVEVVNKVIDYALSRNYKCNLDDGVRVDYDDGFALIRKSNTGPFITMRYEASTKEKLNQRQKEFTAVINKYLK